MKKTFLILAIFLLKILSAYGQKQQTTSTSKKQNEIIGILKQKVDQKWVRKNPSLNPTKYSFFNKYNESKYFVGLIQISGNSIPFTWDNNLSLLKFLMALENEIVVKQGIDADQNYKGTKVIWKKSINGLIWFNNKSYKALVENWHLFGSNECVGTIIFPNLSFKKVAEIPNAVTNNIQGLTILPYNQNIKIKTSEIVLTTTIGKSIKGTGYDLNNDAVFDVFSYIEEIDDNTTYKRLYMNVGGKWKCKWISLNEECV